MVKSYRIVKRRHANNAFDGEGARIAGGRWSSPGTRVVYTAGSASLATLEMLVHLERSEPLAAYVILACEFDEALISEPEDLPEDWNLIPTTAAVQRVGDAWAHSNASAILRVPSVIVVDEFNYLMNPLHPDFSKVSIDEFRPFSFDSRLVRW